MKSLWHITIFFQCVCWTSLEADSTQTRPNIVLVMADDQGIGDMGYTGHPFIQTPHFDTASKTGVRFDQFYAAAPVCSPTRASVLTGRHPNRMGVFKWGYPMRPQELTLAEVLQKNGYATGHFGKWHLGSVRNGSPAHPGANGFDHWVSAPNFYDNDPILSHEGKAVQHQGESSELAVDLALNWIEEKVADPIPFFAVVWFGSPHSPHRAIPKDQALYEEHPDRLKHFFGEVTGMDRAFGNLRDRLEAMGVRDNTILWYCSDNGALPKVGSTSGYRGHKSQIYEGGLRVPSFLEWPNRIKSPRVVKARSQTCDIFPTLLDWLDIETASKLPLDGISLTPYMDSPTRHHDRSSPMGFWDYTAKGVSTPSAKWMGELFDAQENGNDLDSDIHSLNAKKLPYPLISKDKFPGHAAWIDGHLKLHRIDKGKGDLVWELYDLKSDPTESYDMLTSKGVTTSPKRVGKLQDGLENWLGSVVDSLNGKDY
ncbi:MAG: sulfatase-like hydrolase/transferase [Verrucomicrobia bacterium]|jgi:arylsulfatase A-like enzyme|nr:sulfatase-like hydrolase/transferase [Verrucomicrobiota bacterium]